MDPRPKAPSVPNSEKRAAAEHRGEAAGGLDPATVDALGDALQTFYRSLIEEPLPARLLDLLAKLDAKEGNST